MEPLFETHIVWTREHGIESSNFADPSHALGYALELKEFVAYRDIDIYVSKISRTPTDLSQSMVHSA